jgi:ABC-type multidrug transport system ATPase subunit
MGMMRPGAGSARILGRDCWDDRLELKRDIGYVPDEALFPTLLTGREVLGWTASLHGLSKSETADRGAELLERVGLTQAAGRLVDGYSFGMRKRLMLACALIHRPRVLLLDEPAAGLDPPGISDLNDLLAENAADGVAVLLSSHLLPQAEAISAQMTLISTGRTLASDRPAALRRTYGLAPGATLDELFSLLTAP